ncbi:TetR/AcrR family transcriptional regulator [Desulfosporosinus sp. PR]|uniref:TetR/AcrR family transcriptional regulator n=1 Tax=Candidatus Desulfosporosinus nitrosoreducens TaxID=3401928 RepID=UPI0027EB1D32|nr:TetR/AcrR family transcriptional regulator [Desulfosporosinus sp. PR]MDQ7096676.1 TetR/AcrR family transcriptional regulator [Desulfosporosinus sp. PR]
MMQTDLRIKRTKADLREALIDLISEKGFDAVTVGDIAERAMINRATFYRHYHDKYELVTSIFQESVDKLLSELGHPPDDMDAIYQWHNEIFAESYLENPNSVSPKVQSAIEAWIKFFEHFAKYARLYQAMLGRRGSAWFTAQLIDYLKNSFYKNIKVKKKLPLQRSDNDMPLDVGLACLASWPVSVLTWWLENGMEYSPRQMAVWTLCGTYRGIHRAMGVNLTSSKDK